MGSKFIRVKIIEYEKIGDEYPMVYGKGRNGHDLVYFQLDGAYLRTPANVKRGGVITVTPEEVVGIAPDHFRS